MLVVSRPLVPSEVTYGSCETASVLMTRCTTRFASLVVYMNAVGRVCSKKEDILPLQRRMRLPHRHEDHHVLSGLNIQPED